ncbi:putative outer membrane lipoprotein [Legionella busanensis]|uniref:Putative outer membrane lipoprotein n=1 Tax=Legionella busanensis TaxID=190655 RepID=A0A378KEG5_9GAMM|nr:MULTISPECIES: DUF4156 domain-containing protein [Legionella]STX81642.1 putative outer membrane lipoprotein [Legionella busanensis]
MKRITYAILSVALQALMGCSNNVALLPEAQKVTVTQSHAAIKHCKNLGKLMASDVNGVSQAYQSHEHLYQDELNILKNQTAQLGGNTLVIISDKATYAGNPQTHLVDTHRLEGIAYQCR